MISALQTKFQKHHKVVFFLLLAVIIVAFVFTIGAAPGFGGDGPTARRDFFGHNLASEREMRDIVRIGEIAFRIEFGDEQADPRHFEGFVFERLALLGLADRMGIPGPTDDQIRHFITGRRIFQDETGRFDPRRFNDFRDEVEANPQITEGEVATILAQSFRADKVRELLGGPGYILPTEIRLQLERNQTLWTVDFGVIDLAELRAEVEVTEEELEQFFEENAFRYERSPRTVFSFVRFPPDRFFQQVQQPSQQELEAHFERNRARFTPPPPANEDEATVAPEVTLADVRDQVEQSLLRERARRVAARAASDFAYALFEGSVRPGTPQFDQVVSQFGGEMREAPPASREQFPQELGFPRQVQQEVFRLSRDRHFSDPLPVGEDHIVLVYHDTLPAFIPPLAEVRATVERDYRMEEERRLAAEQAEEKRAAIRNRMQQGEDFLQAAEAEGLEVRTAERFSRASPPQVVNPQLVARLDEFRVGEVSPMIPLQNHGHFVHVREREVPEIDRTSDEFAQTAESLRMWSTMAAQNYLLQEVIERELSGNRN